MKPESREQVIREMMTGACDARIGLVRVKAGTEHDFAIALGSLMNLLIARGTGATTSKQVTEDQKLTTRGRANFSQKK